MGLVNVQVWWRRSLQGLRGLDQLKTPIPAPLRRPRPAAAPSCSQTRRLPRSPSNGLLRAHDLQSHADGQQCEEPWRCGRSSTRAARPPDSAPEDRHGHGFWYTKQRRVGCPAPHHGRRCAFYTPVPPEVRVHRQRASRPRPMGRTEDGLPSSSAGTRNLVKTEDPVQFSRNDHAGSATGMNYSFGGRRPARARRGTSA